MSRLCVAPATFESRLFEDRTPLSIPTNESCPVLLSRYSAYVKTEPQRRIECCTSEPQQALLARLKLRSCDGATVGVRQVLEALRGRTLAFVGDSVQHQFYNGVVFDLASAGIPFSTKLRDPDWILPPATFDETQGCISRARGKPGGSEVDFHFRHGARAASCSVTGFTQRSRDFIHCRNLAVEEVYIPATNTRMLWYRMNGNCTPPPHSLSPVAILCSR